MLCCHILYLHIEEHFHPPHIQIFQHTSQWSFGQKSRRKSKSNIYSYCSKNSSTCYNLFFFSPPNSYIQTFYLLSAVPSQKRTYLWQQNSVPVQLAPIQENITTLLYQDYAYTYVTYQITVVFLIYLHIKQNIQNLSKIF